jgi:dihydroneopterin aldolase
LILLPRLIKQRGIILGGLKVDTIIGIYDWEREIKQTVILDIEMAHDIKKAAATDDIEDTLDYKAVSQHVVSWGIIILHRAL